MTTVSSRISIACMLVILILPGLPVAAAADQIIVFRDSPMIIGTPENIVTVALVNDVPRSAVYLAIEYDPEALVLQGASSVGRLLPDVETIVRDDGAGVVRVVAYDIGASGTPVSGGSGTIIELSFATTLLAQHNSQSMITVTAASAATDADPPAIYNEFSFTQAAIDIIAGVGDPPAVPVLPGVLHQNVPNPFNPSTDIKFETGRRDRVRISVYDLAGRLVGRLLDEIREPGSFVISWPGEDANGRRLASGVYFIRLDVGSNTYVKKAVLLK